LALETKSDPKQELAALMRAAHCIKGAARIVQIESAVNLAHVMEDCFVAAQAQRVTLTGDRLDVLLQGVDILLHIAEAVAANPNLELSTDVSITSVVNAIANILVSEATPGNQETISAPVQVLTSKEAPSISQNRAVRMSTDNLNRLMGLAGESLVEANWLEPFANSLLKLKANQGELSNMLEKLQDLLGNELLNRQIKENLTAIRQKANECCHMTSDRQNELELFSQRSANLAQRLYQEVIATRMCSFSDGGQGFPRMVRDLAKQLGKQVNLEIVGKSTLVDRDILERLEAPLTHILRNAIAHGIELPQERLAVGKSEAGIIRIEVAHRAGMLFITVSDDGRGIDIEFLRQAVISKQLTNPEYAFGLTRIEQVVILSRSNIALSENRPFFLMNNQPVELILASQVLELPSPAVNTESLSVIVISDRFNCYGLVVDRFLGEHSLVVRPLDSRLGKVPNISAAALMDDGSPVLIVDVEDLVRSIVKVFSSGQLSQVNQSAYQVVSKTYKRVLVVDDSITVREMERKLLENNGYKVEVAVNGMDGWNAVRSGNYHLVVTDIDMPRMNGFELTSLIKTHAKLKQTPVIIVSYKDREEDRLQGLEAGADYYLTKSSFHDDTLLKAAIDLIGEA
jgi:chemotaxis protein histidine kinase CheA